jgi:4-alpha-glucanotransferase
MRKRDLVCPACENIKDDFQLERILKFDVCSNIRAANDAIKKGETSIEVLADLADVVIRKVLVHYKNDINSLFKEVK